MKTLPMLASLLARLAQALRYVQASISTWAPRPTPVLMPILVDRRRQDSIQRRRPSGF